MADREKIVEQRKHNRFQVKSPSFAVLRPNANKLGQIIDISRGGLAFRYDANKAQGNRASQLAILADNSFCLDEVPIKTISDFELDSADIFKTMRRCGVQFGKLTPDQTSHVEFFIRNYATRERMGDKQQTDKTTASADKKLKEAETQWLQQLSGVSTQHDGFLKRHQEYVLRYLNNQKLILTGNKISLAEIEEMFTRSSGRFASYLNKAAEMEAGYREKQKQITSGYLNKANAIIERVFAEAMPDLEDKAEVCSVFYPGYKEELELQLNELNKLLSEIANRSEYANARQPLESVVQIIETELKELGSPGYEKRIKQGLSLNPVAWPIRLSVEEMDSEYRLELSLPPVRSFPLVQDLKNKISAIDDFVEANNHYELKVDPDQLGKKVKQLEQGLEKISASFEDKKIKLKLYKVWPRPPKPEKEKTAEQK